jgi:ribosomal protein S6--L-glutamate ligase
MILSYHPCVEADKNFLCAGREPDADDLAAIKAAKAVILPQGCYASLYEMATNNCPHVFPNFDARFGFPGKIGQSRLFRKARVPCPETEIYLNVDTFYTQHPGAPKQYTRKYPFVFKFDWGGEGDQVYLIDDVDALQSVLQVARRCEKTGQSGFVLQEYIPTHRRSLRVVVIGQSLISYWRVQKNRDKFGSGLAAGAEIDADADPDLQKAAIDSVKAFCNTTSINLAGFDILYSTKKDKMEPLFLEINYYFGRRGLGGSERFYEILNREVKKWIDSLNLSSVDK